jgi:hypothetical protein
LLFPVFSVELSTLHIRKVADIKFLRAAQLSIPCRAMCRDETFICNFTECRMTLLQALKLWLIADELIVLALLWEVGL